LQPKFDPSHESDILADSIETGEDSLPTTSNGDGGLGGGYKDDEFRPFIRRLPEWNFWLSGTRATVLAFFCTASSAFDVPVYWPILLVYFFILFSITMRRQIQHMIKYKYIPFDLGKVRYNKK